MTRALSQDLRDRLIAAVDGGMSCNKAAERFGIAVSSAVRWVHAWRTEGRAKALAQGGDLRSHHIEAYRDVILTAIETEVDITLVELAELLSAISTVPRLRPARSGASLTATASPSKTYGPPRLQA